MAGVPVQIDGVVWLDAEKRAVKASVIGTAFIVGLTPGGGPIIPPDQAPPGGGGGGPPPHPEHPIWGGPGFPDMGPGYPPVVGGGPIIPDQPPDPPTDLPQPLPPSSVVKEAPAGGGWGYYTDAGSSLYPAYRPAGGAGSGPKSA
jgi:hypothetical protein